MNTLTLSLGKVSGSEPHAFESRGEQILFEVEGNLIALHEEEAILEFEASQQVK